MVLGGFFVNENTIPYFLYPFRYLSVFKWVFTAMAWNEYTDLHISCGT